MNISHDTGVHEPIGQYSDAMEVAGPVRWLTLSGTPGFAPDGSLPGDFVAQAENAWSNVKRALDCAGFTIADLVKVTTYLTSADDILAYKDVRTRALEDLRPAFMLLVVPGLVRPDVRIEIEAWAAKSTDDTT
jgi:2-iminobutanoate/2-iminopropanoate deaminase